MSGFKYRFKLYSSTIRKKRAICFVRQMVISLILLLLANSSRSQYSGIYFDHLTTTEHLSQNSVACMLQDSYGFMWFATQAGVDRYDGVNFLHFASSSTDSSTINGGIVNVLYEDTTQKLLWIGTSSGICTIDLANENKIQHYHFRNENPEQNVISIKKDKKERIWVATVNNLYYLDQDIFVPTNANSQDVNIADFTIDPSGRWGLISTNKGLYSIAFNHSDKIQQLSISQLNPDTAFVRAAFYKEKIIIAFEKGAYIIRSKFQSDANGFPTQFFIENELKYEHSFTYKRIQSKDTLSVTGCSAILIDKKENIWLGMGPKGLIMVLPTMNIGKEFVRDFNSNKSLSSTNISSLTESRDGTLWIGTNGGGVNKYSYQKPAFFRYFTSNFQHVDLIPNTDLWSIYQINKNEVLLGTDGNGIVKFNLASRQMIDHYFNRGLKDLNTNIVRVLASIDSSMLIGTQDGLFLAPLKNMIDYKKQKKIWSKGISSLLVTTDNIWAGTLANGLIIFDKNYKVKRRLFDQTSPSARINILLPGNNKNEVFVGTTGGCYVIGQVNDSFKIKQNFLEGVYITCALQKNDTLWIGTKNDGLYCIDSKSGNKLMSFSMANGLIDQSIYGILNDETGKIWFSTNKGISVYFIKYKTFNHYTRVYGLQHDEFNLGAYSYNNKIDAERAYFGGVNGLNTFNPLQNRIENKDYDVCIMFHKKGRLVQLMMSDNSKKPFKFEVDPMEDSTKLMVRVLDYHDAANNKYKYKLNEEEWSAEKLISEELILPRKSLNHWTNQLKLIIRSGNGTWKELDPIEVELPITFSSQFKYSGKYVLLVFVALLTLLGLLLNRVHLLRKRKKQLEKSESQLHLTKSALEENIVQLTKSESQLHQTKNALEEKVDQLDAEKKKYEQLSDDLTEQNKELTQFQHLLDEVSKSRSLPHLTKTVLKHLTSTNNFDFDYAVVSDVNYFDNHISIHSPLLRNNDENESINSQELKNAERIIPLRSNEVTAVAAEENINIEIDEEKITTILKRPATPDNAIYNIFGHKDIIRLIMPVSLVSDHAANGSSLVSTAPAMALLEVGYRKNRIDKFDNAQITKLSIYANNLAYSYSLISERETESLVQNTLANGIHDCNGHHIAFLSSVLKSVCKEVNATYGAVIFHTFNDGQISDKDIAIRFQDINNKDKFFLQGLLSCKALYVGKAVFYNNTVSEPDTPTFQYSQLSVPLKYNNVIIGCVEIVNMEPDSFNSVNKSFAESVFEKAGPEFVTIKFHHAIAGQVSPNYILRTPEENLQPVITAIKDYFRCNYISIWMRDYTDSKTEFKQVKASDVMEEACKNYGKKSKLIEDNSIPELTPIKFGAEGPNEHNQHFWQFARDNGFLSFIHIPMRIEEYNYGFINVYSKRVLEDELFQQDKQFLEVVSNKTTISFVTSKLINRFSHITQSLTSEDLNDVLQKITDSAREALNADLVLLFRYKNDQLAYEEAATIISGSLHNKGKIFESKKANFLELIIKEGNEHHIKSEADLPKAYKKEIEANGITRPNFWVREHIKSLAVIVLKYDEKAVGVICFNYRKPQQFSQLVKDLISAFSALAATALNNLTQVTTIKEQRENLREKAQELLYEYERIYDKMQDMLPSANRTTLLDIIRQVNHDIINQLLLIRLDLRRLEENAKDLVKTEKDKKALRENLQSLYLNIDRSNDLVKLFNPSSFKETNENFNDIIVSVARLYQARYNINNQETAIDIDLSGLERGMPVLKCSKAEIAMIVYNLISNSDKAIREKIASIDESDTKIYKGYIKLSSFYHQKTKIFHFQIHDNGIGIDKKDIPFIYDLGVTSRPAERSTDITKRIHGIGLYFVKEALILHYNGSIECESYKGQYTIFKLTLKNKNS